MKRRKIPGLDLTLSQVSFGCMRFLPGRISHKDALILLHELVQNGITTFHSSYEYESYSFFCEILNKYRKGNPEINLEHICKIPVPHFKDDKFSRKRFVQLIEKEIVNLGTERIEVVQWLLRHEPNTDEHRLPMLRACLDELTEALLLLKKEGKVGAIYSFPYSYGFAEAILEENVFDGLMDYLNLVELDNIPLLQDLKKERQGFIAIRPYSAGKINTIPQSKQERLVQSFDSNNIYSTAIKFPLLHPSVVTEVVSISTFEHLSDIVTHSSNLESNESLFNNVAEILNQD